jgi:hypothetical protein
MADQVYMADIYTQFEGCGGDYHGNFAGFEPFFCGQPCRA